MTLDSSSNERAVQTREQRRLERKQKEQFEKAEASGDGKRKRIRIRLIPLWLRLIIIILLVGVSAILGTMVGYGVIGDGKPTDALDISTWTYILDLIEKE